MAIGLFDRYCSAESMLRYPSLYKSSQNSTFFNVKVSCVYADKII